MQSLSRFPITNEQLQSLFEVMGQNIRCLYEEEDPCMLQKEERKQNVDQFDNKELAQHFEVWLQQQHQSSNEGHNIISQHQENNCISKEAKQQCSICSIFISIEVFTQHVEDCKNGYAEVSCQYCSEDVISRFINDHYEECLGKINCEFKKLELKTIQMEDELPECAICCLSIHQEDPLRILSCQHIYHEPCINSWFNKSSECPFCRQDVKQKY